LSEAIERFQQARAAIGHAMEDLVAANLVYQNAIEIGMGRAIDL
jgi:ornithine cyclodeaminase/alanine dehydrogenase-like protein (mu-crystallin family)